MSSFNLSINPPQTEILIKPGNSFIQAYEITNNSNNTLLINPSVKPWIPLGIDGHVDYLHALPNPNIEFSLQNTDLALNKSFYLKPNEKKQLVLKVKLNTAAIEGDSYYTFFASQDLSSPDGLSQNHHSLFGSIGTHLLITSSNSELTPITASITNFQIGPQFKDFLFSTLNFSADVNNQSRFFFKTPLQITLTKNKTKINEVSVEPQNVLAYYPRHFTATLKPPFWPGAYTATASLPSEFGNVSASVNFYIFPYSFIITIVTFCIFFSILKRRIK